MLDLVAFKPSSSGHTRGLSIVDTFSGYAACVPLKGGTAKEVAEALISGWICHHSTPLEIQSDRGGEFMAEVMTHL